MNERRKRITRIISLNEYLHRRYAHDLPKAQAQALKIATRDVGSKYAEIDQMIEQMGQYIDEKR